MRKKVIRFSVLCAASAFMLLPSCVNDDYDLSKDIDMTIGVGGDLTLPVSNTEALKLKDVLDLDIKEGDVIDTVPGGDFWLKKKAEESSSFEFELASIDFSDEPTLETFRMTFTMPEKQNLLKSAGVPDNMIDAVIANPALLDMIPDYNPNEIHESDPVELHPEIHLMDYHFTMPEEVLALDSIGFSSPMKPDFVLTTNLLHGELGMHNVFAEFPGQLRHDNVVEGGSWAWQLNDEGHHVYNLPKDVWLQKGAHKDLSLEFVGVKSYNGLLWERSEYPDGKFQLEEDVLMHGMVTIKATAAQFLDMASETYYLEADIRMKNPEIGTVTVLVDPEIDQETTNIKLNDLPDFLTENDVTIYLQEPAIRLNVPNNFPVDVNCWGNILTDKGISVNISEPETNTLQLGGDNKVDWCIYGGRQPEWGMQYAYLQADGLKDIIREVPEQIDFTFDARVDQKFYTLKLGNTYTASIDYSIECPLSFGRGSQIVYADTIDDWHKDIEDYEVKTLKVTAKLFNETPLDVIDFEASAIDLNKQVIPSIQITSLTGVKSGDEIELVLTCTENGAMKNLDGMILKATAKVTEENSKQLNANSTIQLKDIKIGIVGGVIADLN